MTRDPPEDPSQNLYLPLPMDDEVHMEQGAHGHAAVLGSCFLQARGELQLQKVSQLGSAPLSSVGKIFFGVVLV